MSKHIATLEEWHTYREAMEADNPGFFQRNRLRALRAFGDYYYQFGYEVAGYGTIVGCTHRHKTKERAEACGRRVLAGIPTWHIWRKRKNHE